MNEMLYYRHNESNKIAIAEKMVMIGSEPGIEYSFLGENINRAAFKEKFNTSFTALSAVECSHLFLDFTLLYEPDFAPSIASKRSLCLDLKSTKDFVIAPGKSAAVPTGISWINVRPLVPSQWIAEFQVRARSGLASKKRITITNSPATIDEDYTGLIHALVINHGEEEFVIKAGDRIAQGFVTYHPFFEKMHSMFGDFKEERGAKGFGSSGV
jgi:dUTP pyrophosphatase